MAERCRLQQSSKLGQRYNADRAARASTERTGGLIYFLQLIREDVCCLKSTIRFCRPEGHVKQVCRQILRCDKR